MYDEAARKTREEWRARMFQMFDKQAAAERARLQKKWDAEDRRNATILCSGVIGFLVLVCLLVILEAAHVL